MKIRLQSQTLLPSRALFVGAIYDEQPIGIGLGYQYFEDGTLDFGIILGSKYFCISIYWGEAEALTFHRLSGEAYLLSDFDSST